MQLLVKVKKIDYRSWPNLEKTGQCFQDEALFSESELSDQLGICKLGKKNYTHDCLQRGRKFI